MIPSPRTLDAFPHRSGPCRAAFLRARAFLLGAVACFAASCADGTSSGVDNPALVPSLTVSFASAGGTAARVTGELDVYAADQNPAVDPLPLASVPIKNSAFTLLTGDDFKRARQAAAKRGLAKRAAAEGAAAAGDRTAFNLVLITQDQNGGIVLGLAYDSAARAFSRRDSSVKSVSLEPEPLVNYRARIAKDPVHGENCRIYVPGSPFLAAVADSEFVLAALPQGVLPLRLIGGDGRIYPVADSLNTADSGRLYRPSASPTGSIDTLGHADSIPDFQVVAPDSQTVYLDLGPIFLDATLKGVSADDPRLTVLWKWLPDSALGTDTLHRDGHDGGGFRPPPSAQIVSPASLRTEVRLQGDAVFRFRISATLGTRTRSDTAVVLARHLPPPDPRILEPNADDSLRLGRPYDVQWQMAGRGPYTIEVSINGGEAWIPVASHYASPGGLQIYSWIPSPGLGTSDRCLLRVADEVDTAFHAASAGFFHLVR